MSGAFEFDPDRFIERAERPADVVPLREIPDEWEHGLVLLHDRTLPRGATPERWAQIIADALQLATHYAEIVVPAGWSIENLFGFEPDQADGLFGLAVAMRGGVLAKIDSTDAVIRIGSTYTIHRPLMPAGSALLWTFDDRKSGK